MRMAYEVAGGSQKQQFENGSRVGSIVIGGALSSARAHLRSLTVITQHRTHGAVEHAVTRLQQDVAL